MKNEDIFLSKEKSGYFSQVKGEEISHAF